MAEEEEVKEKSIEELLREKKDLAQSLFGKSSKIADNAFDVYSVLPSLLLIVAVLGWFIYSANRFITPQSKKNSVEIGIQTKEVYSSIVVGTPVAGLERMPTPTPRGADELQSTPTPRASDEPQSTPTPRASDEPQSTPTPRGAGFLVRDGERQTRPDPVSDCKSACGGLEVDGCWWNWINRLKQWELVCGLTITPMP